MPDKLPIEELNEAEMNLKDDFAEQWMIDELKQEGFPLWMIKSFILTAKNTKTIILSRTPGGAGIDLIENNYDLKGFQIKAKSCDWGPMAGFICQLPFFNKAGFSNVTYNTGYIMKYLECLDSFSGNKKKLANANMRRKNMLKFIERLDLSNINGEDRSSIEKRSDIKDKFFKFFVVVTKSKYDEKVENILESASNEDKKQEKLRKLMGEIIDKEEISPIVKEYRAIEQTLGKWSGENSIEGDNPFIELKRIFNGDNTAVIGTLNLMRGVIPETVKIIDEQNIYGVAKGGKENDAVWMEFLLRKDNGEKNLWSIYHGRIKYKQKDDEKQEYKEKEYKIPDLKPISPEYYLSVLDEEFKTEHPINPTSTVDQNVAARNKKLLDAIFNFAENPIRINVPETDNFDRGENAFYPLRGFVNPHPPYKSTGKHKNAVSGDYDLFAFWPEIKKPFTELTRLTEKYLRRSLKVFFDADMFFCIEVIPGFYEIASASKNDVLKESAELGNISSLGNLVSGTLNSISANISRLPTTNKQEDTPKAVVLNKAFHSDEGGRPGVLEIEFPIAIFFPESTSTTALNNRYLNKDKSIAPLKNRSKVSSYAGLIKTHEELLQIITEVKDSRNYTIAMQADWLSHLFYLTLKQEDRDAFRSQKGMFEQMFKDLNNKNENGVGLNEGERKNDQKKYIKKIIKSFISIEDNYNKTNAMCGGCFDNEKFKTDLEKLFPAQNVLTLFDLKSKLLELAFKSKREAALRKLDIEQILFGE